MVEDKTIAVVKEAIERARKRKFLESVELAVTLKDVDLSQPKNRIQDEIPLPKGRGKEIKVCVFASGELAARAKSIADRVIFPEEIETLADTDNRRETKKLAREYDFFLAEAPLMPVIGRRLGIILGPLGKMPKPIPPTADPTGIIKNLRSTVRIRSRDKPVLHAPVGVKTMPPEDIAENIEMVLKRITARLERGKQNIASAYVKTTMGPAVRLI